MRGGLPTVAAEMALMGMAGAAGYTLGDLYLQSIGGVYAGVVIAALVAGWAISGTRSEARRAGYRQGHYDGRNGLFDRTDEIR